MKLSIRSGLIVLWLSAGALLGSGVYAKQTAPATKQPDMVAGSLAAFMTATIARILV